MHSWRVKNYINGSIYSYNYLTVKSNIDNLLRFISSPSDISYFLPIYPQHFNNTVNILLASRWNFGSSNFQYLFSYTLPLRSLCYPKWVWRFRRCWVFSDRGRREVRPEFLCWGSMLRVSCSLFFLSILIFSINWNNAAFILEVKYFRNQNDNSV